MDQLRQLAAAAVLGAALAAGSAHAGLVGDTVTCVAVGLTCSTSSSTVGSGVEFLLGSNGIDFLKADFTDTGVTIASLASVSFNLNSFKLTFTDTTNAFTGFNGATSPFGSVSGTLAPSFGGGVVSVAFVGSSTWGPGSGIGIGLNTVAAAQVPEPGSLALAGIALLAAVGAGRRRSNRG